MGPSIQKEECKSSILRTNSQKNMEDPPKWKISFDVFKSQWNIALPF